MVIHVKRLFPDAKLPERASPGAVGYDVYAYHVLDKHTREHLADLPHAIPPGESVLIGIGVAFAVPMPVDCQVRPRSGLAARHDIEISNAPGTIDPDYRGEGGVLLRNCGREAFVVEPGARIAQLVFSPAIIPQLVATDELPATRRDTGGFGSTGLFEIALGDAEYQREQARLDRYFLGIAISASELSNCLRGAERGADGQYARDGLGRYCGATRRFGCVIVRDGTIVAQGFNARTSECSEGAGCVREREGIPTGTALERGCIHAEQAALQSYARSGGPPLTSATVYVNAEPCVMCTKSLMGSGIAAVVVPAGIYPTNGLKLLREAGIEVRHVKP
jgi:dUTP pyrophosphatase